MIRIRYDGVDDEGLVADESIEAWLDLGWEIVTDDPEPEPVWTPVPVAVDDPELEALLAEEAAIEADTTVLPVTPSTSTPPKPDKGKES